VTLTNGRATLRLSILSRRSVRVNPGHKSGKNPSTVAVRGCIQCLVTGTRLLNRCVIVLVLAAGVLALGASAHASPIRPDLKKILAQPPAVMPQFVPARAGWNGPEIATAKSAPNATLESLSPAGTARVVQSSLVTTMVPDFRIVALLGFMILLLRRVYRYEQERTAAAYGPQLVPVTAVEAAEAERSAA
jgi:hypothetical protein